MTNNATRPISTCLRGSRAVAAVSAMAPTATLRAYPEISQPAAASDTEKLDATWGSRPAIRNSVSPMPNPPSASATSPPGIRRLSEWGCCNASMELSSLMRGLPFGRNRMDHGQVRF